MSGDNGRVVGIDAGRDADVNIKVGGDLIGGDKRFFEPASENDQKESKDGDATDYNYNENEILTQAIQKGARGAYWDILRQLRNV